LLGQSGVVSMFRGTSLSITSCLCLKPKLKTNTTNMQALHSRQGMHSHFCFTLTYPNFPLTPSSSLSLPVSYFSFPLLLNAFFFFFFFFFFFLFPYSDPLSVSGYTTTSMALVFEVCQRRIVSFFILLRFCLCC